MSDSCDVKALRQSILIWDARHIFTWMLEGQNVIDNGAVKDWMEIFDRWMESKRLLEARTPSNVGGGASKGLEAPPK